MEKKFRRSYDECIKIRNLSTKTSLIFLIFYRADHNLQDLRIKIFPSKRRNLDAPDSVSSVPLPARRKEISLSSLAITTPKSPVKSSSSGRRSKLVPKKTLVQEEYTSPIEEPIKDVEDPPELSSEPLCRNTQTKRQVKEAMQWLFMLVMLLNILV